MADQAVEDLRDRAVLPSRHLLVVADCAALCHINIHDRITSGRIPLLCCPETDFDISMKLCKIIELNDIRSVAVVKMIA